MPEFPEARISDLSRVSAFYAETTDPRSVIADQARGIPQPIEEQVAGIIEEFEAGQTLEAVCARPPADQNAWFFAGQIPVASIVGGSPVVGEMGTSWQNVVTSGDAPRPRPIGTSAGTALE